MDQNMERSVIGMRKHAFLLFLLLAVLLCACAAADTDYSLSPCPAKITIQESKYIVLTPTNLDEHPELLSKIGAEKEKLLKDWEERGVVLQAWFSQRTKYDACLEISVRQDEDSAAYYDLMNHPADREHWNAYIAAHKGDATRYAEDGYSFKESGRKQQTNKNYFLRLKYKRTTDSKIYWGYAAKTVINGYSLIMDYQVYDRGLRAGDQTDLNRIVNTIMPAVGIPAEAGEAGSSENGTAVQAPVAASLQVTAEPPKETETGIFTVEGVTVPGSRVIGVLMSLASTDSIKLYADANAKTGAFKMKVQLPEENVWLMTLNVEVNDQIVTETVFETTTYSKKLIPVTFASGVPETLSADETVISGLTTKGVDIQCIVSNGISTFDKQIRTNGTGKFSFKVPTAAEAEYHFTLVFSKKNFDTKRMTYTAVRNLTEEDRRNQAVNSAIKPAYNTLVKNLAAYTGRVMVYNVYITDIRQNGDEWIITAAMAKGNSGYRNYVYYMTDQQPDWEIDSQHLIYGTCIGAYQIQSEEGTETYPAFDFLF